MATFLKVNKENDCVLKGVKKGVVAWVGKNAHNDKYKFEIYEVGTTELEEGEANNIESAMTKVIRLCKHLGYYK